MHMRRARRRTSPPMMLSIQRARHMVKWTPGRGLLPRYRAIVANVRTSASNVRQAMVLGELRGAGPIHRSGHGMKPAL